MSFTVADVVQEVREEVSDTAAPFRYSDAFLLRKLNQVVRRIAILRPDLFCEVATMACVAGRLQTAPADSVRIMDVLANTDGNPVAEVDQDTQDLTDSSWVGVAAAATVNWMRYPRDPNRFFVYPKADTNQTLQILYAKCPSTYALSTDVVELQDVYMPVVVDGVVWLVESTDDEHVETGRARMFKDSFTEMLGAGLQARKLTDPDPSSPVKE